jgi:hypothetical protein
VGDKATTKTTIELPTALLKRAKIRAIHEGSDLRRLVIEGLEMRLKVQPKAAKGEMQ